MNIKRIVATLAFYASGVIGLVHAGGLTPPEMALKKNIAGIEKAQLATLKQWVEINSGTANVAGVRKVGHIVAKQLQQLGFEIKWVEEPKRMRRAPTLIATREGKGKRVLLIGHFDTVFPMESHFQHAQLKKLTMKGPGVIDDKGGVVVMLYALRALQQQKLLNDVNITVVLTGDEEESGKPAAISRRPLMDAAKKADVALDFEPSLTMDTASIGRRGITNWRIESHGNEAHSATIYSPDVGDGAIYEMSRILNTFLDMFKDEKYLTVNPGRMVGGNVITDDAKAFKSNVAGKENVVARTALAVGDVRYMTAEQKNGFMEKARKIVATHLPGTKAEISFEDGIPAMAPTKNNLALLHQYSEVSEDLGLGKVSELDAGMRGAGDISYVAEMVPYNLVGLGPMGYGMHSVGETLEIESLRVQTMRAAVLIYRLTH